MLVGPYGGLLGTWSFSYSIGGTFFVSRYDFERVEPGSTGGLFLVGRDLDLGGTVAVGTTSPDFEDYDFVMLDPNGSFECLAYFFNLTSPGRVDGVEYTLYGDCETFISGVAHTMVGTRVGN